MNKNCPIIVAAVGFVVLFTGIICSWYAFPKLAEYEIAQRLALVEGNEVYEIWRKQPFPVKFKAYLFNVTNAPDVQQGANPILKEMGPYVYDEYWERVNISINEEDDTISYMLRRRFYFNEKDSGCRGENDMVTIINGALVSTALQVNMLLPSAMATVNDAVPYLYKGAKDVFVRATVRDILFDGLLISCHDPEIEFVCGAMKGMMPPTMEFVNNGTDFKFSLFGYMNMTDIGPFTIGRGLKNTTRGQIYSFKGIADAAVWAGPTCNMFNGSDSTLFYPMKTPPERIYAFSPDICRAMYVNYEKDDVFDGIPTWRYSNKPESIVTTGIDDCFCPRVKDEDYEDVPKCPTSGLVDITFCVKGPILVSNPHFYLADASLVKFAQGIKPQKELHENFMYFEPTTASPVSGARRLQMNVELKRFEDFTLLNNVSEGVCPMLWLEETVEIPDKYKTELSNGLKMLGMLDMFKWVLIIIGIIIMMSSFILVMYKERLMCFANMSSGKVAITEVRDTGHRTGIPEPISEVNFNSTVLYPSLYPQIDDKNVNDRLVRRNNNLNMQGQSAWQIKN